MKYFGILLAVAGQIVFDVAVLWAIFRHGLMIAEHLRR